VLRVQNKQGYGYQGNDGTNKTNEIERHDHVPFDEPKEKDLQCDSKEFKEAQRLYPCNSRFKGIKL
jgi:hypothetical protein